METAIAAKERALAEQYGELMSLEDLVKALRYPSVQAARKAILRGSFPLEMIRLPPRRGLYVTVNKVAVYLATLSSDPGQSPVDAKQCRLPGRINGKQQAREPIGSDST